MSDYVSDGVKRRFEVAYRADRDEVTVWIDGERLPGLVSATMTMEPYRDGLTCQIGRVDSSGFLRSCDVSSSGATTRSIVLPFTVFWFDGYITATSWTEPSDDLLWKSQLVVSPVPDFARAPAVGHEVT